VFGGISVPGSLLPKHRAFYNNVTFDNGVNTDVLGGNSDPKDLGIIYSDKRNGGRLPYYHRMDVSIKRIFKFSKQHYLRGNCLRYKRLQPPKHLLLRSCALHEGEPIAHFAKLKRNVSVLMVPGQCPNDAH
jgi:hypothetical protein